MFGRTTLREWPEWGAEFALLTLFLPVVAVVAVPLWADELNPGSPHGWLPIVAVFVYAVINAVPPMLRCNQMKAIGLVGIALVHVIVATFLGRELFGSLAQGVYNGNIVGALVAGSVLVVFIAHLSLSPAAKTLAAQS
ncbi:MAG TPA: hypothetical protein VLI05_04605 [Candidatus Saccharimonadia bacterium]|nr:hypothetical protein [Candidatus Saccharimonadia bacterium]